MRSSLSDGLDGGRTISLASYAPLAPETTILGSQSRAASER